ncbi:methylated-DNA--[protein]-cysteine S-methyltransferase [Niallia sp. XMNu-256]|uniref:methylated-DNA--[protein]-cysteine S-methyltransferase n=1 Tax=Niallia sp. XMNu-256 TaxID=3082444 RepID=UPI0030D020DC
MKQPIIYWTYLQENPWNLYIAATEKGLCYVGAHNGTFEEFQNWVNKVKSSSLLIENQEYLTPYAVQISDYLNRKRTNFSVPMDLKGTEFQQSVWKVLCEIPYGETTTYSAIATKVKKPLAVRAVGTAIGKNPILITVPCHRVIGKNGKLTGYRGGIEMKKQLLELERSCL